MSEEFQEISVAETEVAPVGAGAAGGLEAPVASAATSEAPEEVPAEIDATKVNLDAGDNVMRQNAQQTFLENSHSERAGGTPLTAAAIAAKEEEKKEKHAAIQEALDNQMKQEERHREWMERQHEFGGMKISGHDLDKLMNFYGNNPQMMDKLKERMTKSGMSKDKVDKGMKEFQEFMDLKKKEKEGTISDEEKQRLRELQKSEELRAVQQAAVEYAQEHGLKITPQMEKAQAARLTVSAENTLEAVEQVQLAKLQQADMKKVEAVADDDDLIVIADATSEPSEVASTPVTNTAYVAASARENFPKAPAIQKDFSASSTVTFASLEAKKAMDASVEASMEIPDQDAALAAASSQKMPLAVGARA